MADEYSLKFDKDKFVRVGGISNRVKPSRLIIHYPTHKFFYIFAIMSFSIQKAFYSLAIIEVNNNNADFWELHYKNST